jgi:hypothetical protein
MRFLLTKNKKQNKTKVNKIFLKVYPLLTCQSNINIYEDPDPMPYSPIQT